MSRRASVAIAIALLFGFGEVRGQVSTRQSDLRARGCCLDEVETGARVANIRIVGARAVSRSVIRNSIATTESGSFPWSEEKTFDRQDFLDDLQRLYILYQRRGYFDFEIVSYTLRQEGDDVDITFELSEGQPTRVADLELVGVDVLDGDARLELALRDRMPLQLGDVFNEEALLASRDLVEAEFKNRGYAFAQVLLEYRIRKDAYTASISYSVDSGEPYHFGLIRVEGVDRSGEEQVLDQLVFDTGDRYEQDAILDSQRRIYELGLFRIVNVEPQLDSVRADTVDVVVSLVPGDTRLVRVGAGYGTEDLFRVQGSWLDRNFFGRSRQLELRGLFSRLEREAVATYRQPTFLVPSLALAVSTFLRFETEDNYTVERLGTSTRVTYRLGRRVTLGGGVSAERAEFSNFDRGVLVPELGRDFIDPSRLLAVDLGLTYDSTDSLFTPTRGSRARVAYQVGIPIASFDYAYNKLSVEITRYTELRPGWIVAGKILPGAIFTYTGDPDTEGGEGRVPLFQRLFAGGSTSVRGYQRRELGPKDDPQAFGQTRDPEPIGGSGLLETSVELRFPLTGNLRGAAFVDAGNVWADPSQISLTDLEYTPGAGLRYVTPVGPVRFDIARRMAPDDGLNLPRWVFHISIGEAY